MVNVSSTETMIHAESTSGTANLDNSLEDGGVVGLLFRRRSVPDSIIVSVFVCMLKRISE
jgi:hypothetical protein